MRSLPLTSTFVLLSLASAAAVAQPAVDPRLELAALSRPTLDGTLRRTAAVERVPVLIRSTQPGIAAAIEAVGGRLSLRSDGSLRTFDGWVAAELRPADAHRLAATGGVEIRLDGAPFEFPAPLDLTATLTETSRSWYVRDELERTFTGHGVTVCDIDSGVDPLHPLFFRADAGAYDFIDVDGDQMLTPGVDQIELSDGTVATIRHIDVPVANFWDPTPILGSDDPGLQLGMDWLYVDVNDNGEREFGPEDGFTDDDPSFGELLLAADDVDGSGTLDVGERLFGLGTSKIKAIRANKQVFVRGENLIEAPRTPDSAHGTGAAAIIAGGNLGMGPLVGMAPDVELVMADEAASFNSVDFCNQQEADVVLHEYAPWVGYHLDGSDVIEQFIDQTAAQGVSHINPAGNLSGSAKLYKRQVDAGQLTDIVVAAPADTGYGSFRTIGVSVLWRDVTRDLELTLTAPGGASAVITPPAGFVQMPFGDDGHTLYAYRVDSSRGTARVDAWVFHETQPVPIEFGDWTVTVDDPELAGGAPLELIAYTIDDVSGWGKGIHFPEHESEDHLIGFPGTADGGLAVAAYTGHEFQPDQVTGQRAEYSGRGYRIDGVEILSIAGPDNPISAGYFTGYDTSYVVYGGTSGASPHVAGVAALLKQQDMERTGAEIRTLIEESALVDAQTGAVPNRDYGHGKLYAHDALFGAPAGEGTAPTITTQAAEVFVGETIDVGFEVSDAEDAVDTLRFELDRDYDGEFEESLAGPTVSVTENAAGLRYLRLRVIDPSGRAANALLPIEAIPLAETPENPEGPTDEDPPGSPSAEDDGCGCRAAGGASTSRGAWALALLVGAAAWRRRRKLA